MDTYSHVIPTMQKEANRKMNRILRFNTDHQKNLAYQRLQNITH
jgi:hypothetical protein